MGCCLLLFIFALGPRVMMFFMWLFTDWFALAFKTRIWPLLGFFFMPWTTMTYMGIQIRNDGQFTGIWLALFIVAIMIDISSNGAAGSHRRRNKE